MVHAYPVRSGRCGQPVDARSRQPLCNPLPRRSTHADPDRHQGQQAPRAGSRRPLTAFGEVPDAAARRASDAGRMKKTLPAFGAALCALALAAAPAGAAKKPKYYFSISTTETYITVADCKAIPSGRTKETTTTTRFINQTGHLGGGLKTEGWEQTDLKRETIDNEALPPYDIKGEKKPFASKGRAADELRLRGGRWTHTYFGPDDQNHRVPLH